MKKVEVLKFMSGFPLQAGLLTIMLFTKKYIIENYDVWPSFAMVTGLSFLAGLFYVLLYDRVKSDSMWFEKMKSSKKLTKEEYDQSKFMTKFVYNLTKKHGNIIAALLISPVDPSICAIIVRKRSYEFKMGWLSFCMLCLSSVLANILWFSYKGYIIF